MRSLQKALAKIPALLSSMPSIFIFIFLFVYLVVFGLLGLFLPKLAPSNDLQLIFGNYTNVLSALGASLAAGAGAVHTKRLKDIHKKHLEIEASLKDLHTKIDSLTKK